MEKRESESDSFYPFYHPGMHVNPYFGYQPYQQHVGLPSVVPRVLPYQFPYYNTFNPMVRTFGVQTDKVVQEE